MHIEIVADLRCTRSHEDSWLVARADTMVGRHIISGILGCPVCKAEYPIIGGVAIMGDSPGSDETAAASLPADAPLRLAALLGLENAGGVVVLCGEWTRVAAELAEIAHGVAILAISAKAPAEPDDRISFLTSGEELPLRRGSVRGIALGLSEPSKGASGLRSAIDALQPGGRVVAPASVALPGELRELARDDRDQVAVRDGSQTMVSLGRRDTAR